MDEYPKDLQDALDTLERYRGCGWHIRLIDDIRSPEQDEEYLRERQERIERFYWTQRVIPAVRYSTKAGRVRAVVDRLSRNRLFKPEEVYKMAEKISNKISGNPSMTLQGSGLESCCGSRHGLVAFYKGRWLLAPAEYEHDRAIQEAHEEGRPFTEVKKYKKAREQGLEIRRYRAIRVIHENKKLLDQLKKEIRNVQNYECR